MYLIDGSLNDTMKKTVRAKAAAYLKRAEELKGITNTPPALAPANGAVPNVDPDAAQMMQKFEG